jgi:hypothetical protein
MNERSRKGFAGLGLVLIRKVKMRIKDKKEEPEMLKKGHFLSHCDSKLIKIDKHFC